jgi:hypothetical protein
MALISYDNLTKSFHKHLHDHIGSVYYIHFSKLSVGDQFTENLWIQPIWTEIPERILCANLLTLVLRCHAVITEDPLLSNLRQMVDYCVQYYERKESDDPSPTSVIALYNWGGTTVEDPIIDVYAETWIKSIQEIAIKPMDTIAVINIYVNMVICCITS